MDKLTGVENLLSQILLNGDTDRFINELKMLNVSVDEAREMEPFAEPALGQLVATVIEKINKQESVSNVLNELYSKVKTCTKLFSAIGLDGYSEANNVDTKNPDVVNTIEKELVTPVNKDTITEIVTNGKVATPVDVTAKEFSVGDEVAIKGTVQEDGTIKLDNNLILQNKDLLRKDVIEKVEGDLTVTKPKDVPGMNGLVDGIGESTPSTEGNGGDTIEKGVNMSELNFGAIDKFAKGALIAGAIPTAGTTALGLGLTAGAIGGAAKGAKSALRAINDPKSVHEDAKYYRSLAGALDDKYNAKRLLKITKALGGASDKEKAKALARDSKFRKAKLEMKQLKKYGDIRSRVVAARVGGIADAVGNISGAINNNLPAVANVLKTTANTIKDVKHDVAPKLTLENTKKLLEAKNGNIDEAVKELEKKNGVELNSSVHDEWMKVAEVCKNYSAILEDDSVYYRLFSGDELTTGDVVTFSGNDYLVMDSLNNGETSAISTVDLSTGESAMFNVSNNELYESFDFFDFDEGKFASDADETVPVVSTNENKDSDEKYVVVIDKEAKEVTTNGPMSESDADKLCIKTEGTPDTTVLKADDAVEAGKIAEQSERALKVGSLENAGISVEKKADEVPASDVSVGDVTNVETGKGKEEVLIEDKKEGVGGTTTFSATVLDSANTDDVGRTIEFTVDNNTCFSISDFYMEEEGCYFSDVDETKPENKDDTCPECGNDPCTCEEDKMDEVKVLDKPAEVAAAELKEGDVTSIVDNEGNKSDVLVNETRSDGNGNTVVEATVLSSELFSEGEVFMFSAEDGELFSVSANTENDFSGFNFSESGEFWIVAQAKDAPDSDRKKLGPYTKDELKENFEGLQEAGYKVWKFDSEDEADKKAVGKLTTADKIKIGAGLAAGAAALAGAGVAASKLINKNHSEECEECGKLEAKEVEAGDVVECVKDGKPTAVLITEKVEDKDGSVKFSAVTLDDNIVDENTDVTFSALADAEFGYYGTYDFSDETESDEVKPEERLEEIKEEGNVAKTVDEVKPGDVAKVDDTEIVVTEVKPTEEGIKVEGKVVEDKSGNFSVADDVSMVIDADYIFSISDFYDFESNTFFSEKYFSQDITPTEAPAVEIVEKKEVTTAPVDTSEEPVTQLMGEPKTEETEAETKVEGEEPKAEEEVKSCQNNFSAISIEDKLAYLHSI